MAAVVVVEMEGEVDMNKRFSPLRFVRKATRPATQTDFKQ
jgi:hypothetical protein